MAMPAPHTNWTVEMVHALPDDGPRYEVINGELLVSPSPSALHQRAVGELYVILRAYLAGSELEVLFAPFAVTWSQSTEVQPDLLVAPKAHIRLLKDGQGASELVLAVEVLSPSTARHDRYKKRRLYQSKVREYWIVDTGSRLFERWLPGKKEPDVLLATLTWKLLPDRESLNIDIPAYFDAGLA